MGSPLKARRLHASSIQCVPALDTEGWYKAGLPLTLNIQLKTNVAEGEGLFFRSQLTDTADVVIVQINVHKLLLFVHSAPGQDNTRKKEEKLNK